jgi:3-dehydroquinate dehydratase-2
MAAPLMNLRPDGARAWSIAVIDGPNQTNLGRRDPAIYGPIKSLDDLQQFVRDVAGLLGVTVTTFASNHEGDILEFIHRTAPEVDGYIINPAGLTTYGEATRHALADSTRPVVEVHFANISRHFSSVAPDVPVRSRFTHTATGLVMGMRHYSYAGALLALVLALDDKSFLGADAG